MAGTHGRMTGEMIVRIEEILITEKPDVVLVYGDTNSTLAGALAASKLHIPIAHVEAGLRSFWKKMPEEQNRILTDHLSYYLFCPTQTAIKNLKNENIINGVFQSGDIMLDAFRYYLGILDAKDNFLKEKLLSDCGFPDSFKNTEFFLLTIHRAENTNDPNKLIEILKGLDNVGIGGVFPIHPRTRKIIEEFNIPVPLNIILIEPIGYIEMLLIQQMCKFIVTDSGGLQKEAYFMKKPCITLRNETEWVETVESGWNTLVGSDKTKINNAISSIKYPTHDTNLYGDGNSAELILQSLLQFSSNY
jgi:UDP-GlcNAc3NAcA epimerase